jgi:hypothetical protein
LHVTENGRGSYERPGARRCERFDNPRSAIQREKNLERWSQAWKLAPVGAAIPTGATSGRISRLILDAQVGGRP